MSASRSTIVRTVHMYFSDLCDFYFIMIQTSNNTVRIEKDRQLLEQYVIPVFMRKEIRDITSADVKEALERIGKSSTVSNRSYLHRLMINIFCLAVDTALLDNNPAAFTDKGTIKVRRPSSIHIYSEDEMERIYEALRHNYLKNAFALIISCGLSRKAILELKISDYHRNEGILDIPQRDGTTQSLMLSKSQIWFLDQEVDRQKRMEQLRGAGRKPATYLFGDYRGDQLKPRTLGYNVRLVRLHSGVSAFSISGLFRYYIFQSVRYGADPMSVLHSVDLSMSSKYDYILKIPHISTGSPLPDLYETIGDPLS